MRFKATLTLLCIFCLMTGAFALPYANRSYNIENFTITQKSRIYVESSQIHVLSEGLFVEIEGNLYQVSQICQDENGFFIPRADFFWKCPKGHPNPPWQYPCAVCGLG